MKNKRLFVGIGLPDVEVKPLVIRYLSSDGVSGARSSRIFFNSVRRGFRERDFKALILRVLEVGKADTPYDAVQWLGEQLAGVGNGSTPVLSDYEAKLRRFPSVDSWRKRYKLDRRKGIFFGHTNIGSACHYVFESLMCYGRVLPNGEVYQRPLFEDTIDLPQHSLFELSGKGWRSFKSIAAGDTVSVQYLDELRDIRRQAIGAMSLGSSAPWHEVFEAGRPYLHDLAKYLAPVVTREQVEGVFAQDAWGKYLYLLAFLMWVHGVLIAHKERNVAHRRVSVPFVEVPVYNGHGGTADLIEVTRINGNRPRRSDLQFLRQLRIHRQCCPRLIELLVARFGPRIRLRVVDFKFSVGDGGLGAPVMKHHSVWKSPKNSHQRQMLRYLGLFQHRTQLLTGDELRLYVEGGTIDYYFPMPAGRARRIHEIVADEAVLSQVVSRVEERRSVAENNKVVRLGWNRLVRSLDVSS